ncbi:MAG: ABC transporter permease [Promethearchaeota archaeon]
MIKVNFFFKKFHKLLLKNLFQIFAIVEKELRIKLLLKFNLIISFISPVIGIILPIILMERFFDFNSQFGIWSENNYLLFPFIAYNINLLKGLIMTYASGFRNEKYWETLTALIIAPFNRFNLLLGVFFSHLITISIPFTIFFIICLIYKPISISTIFFMLLFYFLIALIFSGLGLIIGVYSISKENYTSLISFLINLFFMFSCLTFPYEIFPKEIQQIINLNPLYYIFDVLRIIWIEDNILIAYQTHAFKFNLLIISSILLPIMGVYVFNLLYRKYGIVGY